MVKLNYLFGTLQEVLTRIDESGSRTRKGGSESASVLRSVVQVGASGSATYCPSALMS